MPLWLLWLLPAYEAGVWTTVFGLRGCAHKKALNTLVYGSQARVALPFLDTQLKKAAGTPTKSQAAVARWLSKGIRWAVNTRALDYAILFSVRNRWPGKSRGINPKVRFNL